jgi:hypothetical protein
MVTFGACAGDDEGSLPAMHLRIATGVPGGVYSTYGPAFAKLVNKYLSPLRATPVPSDGSVDNLERLGAGRAEVAFTLADSAGPALHGTGPFSHPVRLRALAHLYDDYVQIIARRDSGLKRISQLAGKTVSIGAPRSGTALTARRILRLPRLRFRGRRAVHVKTLALEESTHALAARRIDAFVWSGGLPTTAINSLRRRVEITLIELPAESAASLDPNLYNDAQIPKYVYDQERAVRTVTAANLLVVRADLPDEVAFRLTGLLFAHRTELERAHQEAKRLNESSAVFVSPLQLHPGAKRWYAKHL